MKKVFIFSFLLILNLHFSQQTESLKKIKEKYAPEFKSIESKYHFSLKKASKKEATEIVLKRDSDIRALEFKQNEEFLNELSNIKSRKSLINFDPTTVQPFDEKGEIPAKYPLGTSAFRKEISDNFYAGTIDTKGKISTELIFVIERDGSIVDVRAIGENENFNTQAQLAVYLTQEKWEPARINGYPVRYKFRIPLNLNFD